MLLFAKPIAKIFFLQNRLQIPSSRKTFFRKYLLFAKSIANTFAKPSFENIFFLPNRSQIPSQNLLSKISSFRKIDRKYLHFVKLISNIFFRKYLLPKSILLFAKPIEIFFLQNRPQIPSFRKPFFRKYLLFAKSIANIFMSQIFRKIFFAKSMLLFTKLIAKTFFLQNRSQIPSFRKTFFRKYLLFVKSIANTFISYNRSQISSFRKKLFRKNLFAKSMLLFAKPIAKIFFL